MKCLKAVKKTEMDI